MLEPNPASLLFPGSTDWRGPAGRSSLIQPWGSFKPSSSARQPEWSGSTPAHPHQLWAAGQEQLDPQALLVITSSQPAPNPRCSTPNQPTSHLATEALLKNMKEKKTRYLVPTGMSRTQEAFIENTAFKTWHLWPVMVTVVRVAGQ